MQALYREILKTLDGNRGLTAVDSMIKDAKLLAQVRNKLVSNGYEIGKLSDKGVAFLFCALVDLLVVVKDDSFYIATMCQSEINNLTQMRRIIPREDDDAMWSQTNKIVRGNTLEVINEFLNQSKFHFIKLNTYKACESYLFLASVGTMNPYPTLEKETVYCLDDIARWFAELQNNLMRGCLKLKTTRGEVLCQSISSPNKCAYTSCKFITRDLNNIVEEFNIWDILDYERYVENDLEMKLLNGVVTYDNVKVTLNREILEKYYGNILYTTLESIGVRRRYCLEELLSIGEKYSVAYYVNKYNLGIYDCTDIYQLKLKLQDLISSNGTFDSTNQSSRIIHARILYSPDALRAGYKSFYRTISLDDLGKNHIIQEVTDLSSVMPKMYRYYAISSYNGYSMVDLVALSDSVAMKQGETMFIKEFGDAKYFCTLQSTNGIVKGRELAVMSLHAQKKLHSELIKGYVENFKNYAIRVRKICDKNGITAVSDEHIKFLFVNNLARKYPKANALPLADVALQMLDFLDLMQDSSKADEALNKEYLQISWRKVCKEFPKINAKKPMYNGYYITDTPDGRFIKTDYGIYKIGVDGLNKTVEVIYNGKSLGKKIYKEV